MRCQKVKRGLSAFIDGEVSPKLRTNIEEHLRRCTDCFREYQEFRLMIQQTANTPRVPPPHSMFPELRRRMRFAEKTYKFRFPRKAVLIAPIAAVVAVLMFMPLMLNYDLLHFGKNADKGEGLTMNAYLQEHINFSSEQPLPQSVNFGFTMAQNGNMAEDEFLSRKLELLVQYHYMGE
ncbi:MAG: anti-sigma factor family protein [Candidatus Poribacteria bacterium]